MHAATGEVRIRTVRRVRLPVNLLLVNGALLGVAALLAALVLPGIAAFRSGSARAETVGTVLLLLAAVIVLVVALRVLLGGMLPTTVRVASEITDHTIRTTIARQVFERRFADYRVAVREPCGWLLTGEDTTPILLPAEAYTPEQEAELRRILASHGLVAEPADERVGVGGDT